MILPLQSQPRFRASRWSGDRTSFLMIAAFALSSLLMTGETGTFRTIRSNGPLELSYGTVVREGEATELRLTVAPDLIREGTYQVWVGSWFLKHVRFSDIRPTPLGSHGNRGGLTLEFAARHDGRPDTVVLEIRHDRQGSKFGEIGVVGGPEVRFEQLVSHR